MVPLYRGAVKAPWAAVAAAWRTAWLDMTPVANSAWAFWKLASVCLYREWTWRGEECRALTHHTSTNSPSYYAHYQGENDSQNLILALFNRLLVTCWQLRGWCSTGPPQVQLFAETEWTVWIQVDNYTFALIPRFIPQQRRRTRSCHNISNLISLQSPILFWKHLHAQHALSSQCCCLFKS